MPTFHKTLPLALILTFLAHTRIAAEREPFRPKRVVPALPAIKDAPFITAEKASKKLAGDDLVLGVAITSDKEIPATARAYPINMLTGPQREIINDSLGGRAIAATW